MEARTQIHAHTQHGAESAERKKAMPSSHASSSSSHVVIIVDRDSDDDADALPSPGHVPYLGTQDAVEEPGIPRESAARDNDSDGDIDADGLPRSGVDAVEHIPSSLGTQDAVEDLCRNHGVPREFVARSAGDHLRASSPPTTTRAVCMYKHMLEAGVRVPLHAFFCEALNHFGLAPGQLVPNGWRILLGFVALCHDAGVRPSLPVFRHFFSLVNSKGKRRQDIPGRHQSWYFFRSRPTARALFDVKKFYEEWKGGFFFLTSPEPWPCPVRWGEPPLKKSTVDPALTMEEEAEMHISVQKLLRVHSNAVDLQDYLHDANRRARAADLSSNLTGTPPLPSPRSSRSKGTDPSAARATEKSSTTEQGGELPLFIGKKRKQAEAAPLGSVSIPPGLGLEPRYLPEARREVLECVVTPSREREFAADVVASSNVSKLQLTVRDAEAAALREKLTARDAEVAALKRDAEIAALQEKLAAEEVADLRKKLAAQDAEIAARARDAEVAALREKQAARDIITALQEKLDKAEAEKESVKAAAVQQFVESEEHKRCLAEHALAGFERGAEKMKCVALRLHPGLDASRLVVSLD